MAGGTPNAPRSITCHSANQAFPGSSSSSSCLALTNSMRMQVGMAAWDHGKLNASFEKDGEVQALYREAAGFDQSQGKTVR